MDDEVHRASGGRSSDTSPDPEMVEGGSIGRRPMVGDETGYAAGSSGITADRQRVLAIRDFSIAATTQFLAVGIIYGGQFLIPLFLTTGCSLTATQTGWILGSMGVGMPEAFPIKASDHPPGISVSLQV